MLSITPSETRTISSATVPKGKVEFTVVGAKVMPVFRFDMSSVVENPVSSTLITLGR